MRIFALSLINPINNKNLVLTLILAVSLSTLPVSSAGETSIKVINPITDDGSFVFSTINMTKGTRFNGTVWLYDVVDLFAFQIKLYANDSLLNITRAWLPTWDSNYIFAGQTTIQPTPAFYDEDSDGIIESVLVGDSLLFGDPVTGNGLLAIIELEIIYTPSTGSVSCNLNINNEDTYALDSSLTKISCVKVDGYYELTTEGAITINITPRECIFGSNLTIYGNVIPTMQGTNVTIWYRANQTGAIWTQLATVLTETSGYYVYNWTTDRIGTFELKANWTNAESQVILVDIKYGSTIMLMLSAINVTVRTGVTVSGSIDPIRENVTVTIEYRCVNVIDWTGGEWAFISEVQTNSQGAYNYTWIATKEEIGTNSEKDTFEFRARWNGDNETFGNESQIIRIAVWKTHIVSLTLNVEPKKQVPDYNVTVSGKITPAIPNATITIHLNKTGPGGFHREIIKVITDGNGNYIHHYKLASQIFKINDIVTFTAKFEETKDFFNFTSSKLTPSVTITIIGLFSSNITLKVEPTSAYIYSNIALSGKIISEQEIPAGQTVTVEYRRINTTDWNILPVGYVSTNETGHFYHVWNITIPAGEYELRATWIGYKETSGAKSSITTLTVMKLRPSLTLEAIPQTATLGDSIILSGILQLKEGGSGNVTGLKITLRYKAENGNWTDLAEIKTGPNGRYSYVWAINQTGIFTVEAKWEGNRYYETITATTTVIVEIQFLQKYLIYIAVGTALTLVAIATFLFKKRKTA
jgi:hypothetical protein